MALRDIILHERRIELAFENHRWNDLLRTGKSDLRDDGTREPAETDIQLSASQFLPGNAEPPGIPDTVFGAAA